MQFHFLIEFIHIRFIHAQHIFSTFDILDTLCEFIIIIGTVFLLYLLRRHAEIHKQHKVYSVDVIVYVQKLKFNNCMTKNTYFCFFVVVITIHLQTIIFFFLLTFQYVFFFVCRRQMWHRKTEKNFHENIYSGTMLRLTLDIFFVCILKIDKTKTIHEFC